MLWVNRKRFCKFNFYIFKPGLIIRQIENLK